MAKISIPYLHFLISCMMTIIIMEGCADDLRNRTIFDGGAGEAIISFSVENLSSTRNGVSSDMESEIDHAYLLFYSAAGALENEVPVAAARAEVKSSQPGSLSFSMPSSLEPNKDYRSLAIANADDFVPNGYSDFKEYLETWCNNASSTETGPLILFSSSCIAKETKLPMNCGSAGDCKFQFSQTNGVYDISASLSFRRMVARIDVANIVKEGFVVEKVALCNWRDSEPAATSDSQLGNRVGNIKASLSDVEGSQLDIDFIDMPAADEAGIQQLTRSLYCFPSVSYDSYLGDKESTALIIKAKYGEDSASSYYRINVGKKGNLSKVVANTKYLVTIQSVKGSGASTPEEAYVAKESPIVLSVVEDWDLEEGHYASDDFGNFIVVSKGGTVEFAGDASDNIEIKVLTSKGLNWSAEYINNNEASVDAFNVVKLSDASLAIGPKGTNDSEEPLSGVCRVFATTTEGGSLEVNIPLKQNISEEKPYEPEEPTNLPFAIIPLSRERVKIDHNAKTIEIDGFDPNCFNSFIDIPFKVFINESSEVSSISLTSDLEWPLEGRFSKNTYSDYCYCPNSFSRTNGQNTGSVYSLQSKKEVTKQQLIGYSNNFTASKNDIVYLSVGAMGPDDPAIVRSITLSNGNGSESVKYDVTIKPRPVIIEDVIFTDNNGQIWLIQDRNVQNNVEGSDKYIGRDQNGIKYQAYNYSYITFYNITIPCKYNTAGQPFNENFHELYMGKVFTFKSSSSAIPYLTDWMKMYIFDMDKDRNSPFYEENDISKWKIPTEDFMRFLQENIKVSKMRMFLVSEIAAKNKKVYIPICCYLPYSYDSVGDASVNTFGYFLSKDDIIIEPFFVYYVGYGKTDAQLINLYNQSHNRFTRLVRTLNERELEDYKNNFLGYGSQPHKLTICHPDTYGSDRWVSR